MAWEMIGMVGVDSGQLMICDPGYMGMWQGNEYYDMRIYSAGEKWFAFDTQAARVHFSRRYVDGKIEDCEFFSSFQSVLSTGKTPNEHIAAKEWQELEIIDNSFSYNGVSHKRKIPHKQINYPLGHAGLAVAFNSGYGDGVYPVYARIQDGRVLEVKIVMDEED